MPYTLHRETWVPRPLDQVFDFFSRADNLERITPPWLEFRIRSAPPEMREGAHIEYALRVHGIPFRWITRLDRWDPPREFVDVQEKGPYGLWRHTHRFAAARGGTTVEDTVEYALPFGPLGRIAHAVAVRRDVERIFAYRARMLESIFPSPSH